LRKTTGFESSNFHAMAANAQPNPVASVAIRRQLPAVVGRHKVRPMSTSQKVLVVDDNADCADSLAALLAMIGHDVRAGYCGAQALELARSFQPDVVFLDVAMPDVSGLQVARQIREEAAGATIKICLLSGHPLGPESVAHGADLQLLKPVELSALRQVLS
jgi:CheY-like chemotaxis protein